VKKTGLLLLSTVFLLSLSACSDIEGGFVDATAPSLSGADYQFEPEARAVLEPLQIPSSRHPKVDMRASGGVYMLGVYQEGDSTRLGLFTSHNGGDAFAPPTPISGANVNVSSHGENSPSLDFGTLREAYVLFEQITQGEDTELMFARSLNTGFFFEKPYKITDKEVPSSNAFSSMRVAPNGDIWAAWLDSRDDPEQTTGKAAVFVARSTDRGESFGENIRLGPEACPCCRPTFAFGDEGEVFVSWRHVFEGSIRDMVVATSRDGGETFEAPVRIAEDNWHIEGCPHSGASIVHSGGRLYAAWFTAGSNAEPGIRFTWSDDAGRSFAPAVNAAPGVRFANHPMLTHIEGGGVLLTFQGRAIGAESEWSPVSPYLVAVGDGGELSLPMQVPGNRGSISYPVLTADSQGGVFVAWTEATDQGNQIVMSRGATAVSGGN
jgi:hypothetical protein